MGRRLLIAALALALSAGVSSCAAPSVPIPPPSPEAMAFEVDATAGTASFTYQPTADYAGAIVYVFNRDSGQGVITTADPDGAVAPTAPFPARDGDEIVVSFELERQLASTCVHLRDGSSSSSLECDL
jgi:hypothetical protein